MKTGQEAGFSTVEAFAEKMLAPGERRGRPPLSLHEVQSNRRPGPGLPRQRRSAGIQPFQLPMPGRSRRCFAGLSSRPRGSDRKKNFAQLLPRSAAEGQAGHLRPGDRALGRNAGRRTAGKDPGKPGDFPGAEAEKIPFFPGAEKSLPGQHAAASWPSTKKRISRSRSPSCSRTMSLELSESHIYFSHFDPRAPGGPGGEPARRPDGRTGAGAGPANLSSCRPRPRCRC